MREYLKNTVKQALIRRRGRNAHPVKRIFTTFLGITILTTTLITALLPVTDIPVYAADNVKKLQLGTGPFENGATVYYGSKTDAIEWKIIGFNGNGVASGSENATLISSGVLGTTQFSASEGRYKDSLLHTEINNILSNRFTDKEKADTVMLNRTLPGKEDRVEAYASADSNYIWGTDLSGQKLWPLSTHEANTLYNLLPDIAGIGSDWWLRSRGEGDSEKDNTAAYVPANSWPFRTGENVNDTEGVRPAFNINLSSIILTSAAEGGKNPGTKGAGTLNEVAAYTGTAWKLTIFDSARSSFTASAGTGATVSMPEGYSSWTVPVTYSGAKTGTNEHVSAILTNSNGVARYYGYIATNSAASTEGVDVTIPTGLSVGTYKLKVFNEQVNGTNGNYATDLSSAMHDITLTVNEAPDQVATPIFSPAERTYTEAQSVTISCGTTGATIHYTTDGTTPTTSSQTYSSAINVSETKTIKAIAVKTGMTDSSVASATYTINIPGTVATPTFTPAAGTYAETQSVTISCSTDGATIHYTTDGTDPTDASPTYSSPIAVSDTTTVKAIAVKDGMTDSSVASAKYTISDEPVAVTGVSVSPTEATLKPDATKKLTATVEPDNASNKEVTWESDDENIAAVSDDGTVTAKAEGETTITVKTVDGNKTATCKVIVKKDAPVVETCNISFDANGGKGEMDDQTVDKGVRTQLNKNKFTRSGYSFDSWNTDPDGDGSSYDDKDYITVEKDTTLYAQWKKGKPKHDDDGETEEPSKPAVVNPDTVEGYFAVNGQPVPGVAMGKTVQGVAAQAVFNATRPAGFLQAFTFNMAVNGKVDYTLKNGVLTIIIPKGFQKAGRTFAIMALDKNGRAWVYADTDTNPNTVTATINVEGYAFSLIYKD